MALVVMMITVLDLRVWSAEYVWKLVTHKPRNAAARWLQVVHSTQSDGSFWYHYELIDLKMFNVFESTAVIILFDAQIVHVLASGSQFKLSPEGFQHNPTILWSLPCFFLSSQRHLLKAFQPSLRLTVCFWVIVEDVPLYKPASIQLLTVVLGNSRTCEHLSLFFLQSQHEAPTSGLQRVTRNRIKPRLSTALLHNI